MEDIQSLVNISGGGKNKKCITGKFPIIEEKKTGKETVIDKYCNKTFNHEFIIIINTYN